MQDTAAEFDNDEELVKAYADLLAEIEIKKGSKDTKDEIIRRYKLQYKEFSKKENKPSFDLWVEDARKCYNNTFKEYNQFIKKENFEKVKEHYDHKIPLDLYNATKDDFDKGVVEMLAKEGNLFIKGASDIGKSHLAVAVLREHLNLNPNLKIEMFFEDDFHEMTYEESQKEIKRLKKLDGVIFDDLGAIGLGVDKRNLIKGLIYSNFRNNKLVIICTNCIIDELYDSRTGSKIVRGCTIVNKKDTGTGKKNRKEITV